LNHFLVAFLDTTDHHRQVAALKAFYAPAMKFLREPG